ncbi:MAG: hypothetical protein J6O49_13420 [Bacteroidaceae bacterium]|nr:hypothetical protein [Bacteroidaceae bacterium]
MAKKELTEEQQNQIKTLLANNEMLEKTLRETQEKGRKGSVEQIKRAQQEVIDHINSIDPTALETAKKEKKKTNTVNLFGDTDVSIFDMLDGEDEARPFYKIEKEDLTAPSVKDAEAPMSVDVYANTETVIAEETMFNEATSDSFAQYDVIQLPSNGQCYKSKMDRVPVAYLTAYDENIITSPNLYKDGLVIDFLLKSKIVNKDINPDDLVSGDVDAITLFLRATSYGPEFPIVVRDPETGEQIDTTVDLTTLKPREFKLIGDENGWFEFETPIKKDKIKFRYLTRKQEKQLQKITELENNGTKAYMLDSERETLTGAILSDKLISDADKKTIKSALTVMEKWSTKLKEVNDSRFNRIVTNSLQLQVMAVNGNTDREFIKKYINSMPARDSLMLRRYINENRPGINFDIEVERPESLGGGSFSTFLNWDDSVFLNIAEL